MSLGLERPHGAGAAKMHAWKGPQQKQGSMRERSPAFGLCKFGLEGRGGPEISSRSNQEEWVAGRMWEGGARDSGVTLRFVSGVTTWITVP